MILNRLDRKIARTRQKAEQYTDTSNLSTRGYWSKGYFDGMLSILEDLKDELKDYVIMPKEPRADTCREQEKPASAAMPSAAGKELADCLGGLHFKDGSGAEWLAEKAEFGKDGSMKLLLHAAGGACARTWPRAERIRSRTVTSERKKGPESGHEQGQNPDAGGMTETETEAPRSRRRLPRKGDTVHMLLDPSCIQAFSVTGTDKDGFYGELAGSRKGYAGFAVYQRAEHCPYSEVGKSVFFSKKEAEDTRKRAEATARRNREESDVDTDETWGWD